MLLKCQSSPFQADGAKIQHGCSGW